MNKAARACMTMVMACAGATPFNAAADIVSGSFSGWIVQSYDQLSSKFHGAQNDGQNNWTVQGAYSYDTALAPAPSFIDPSVDVLAAKWRDPTFASDWLSISLTFFDLSGNNRGTVSPTPGPYAPSATAGYDFVSINDYDPLHGRDCDPYNYFTIADEFWSPAASPTPSIYRHELISGSVKSSHYWLDFISFQGGLQQSFQWSNGAPQRRIPGACGILINVDVPYSMP